MTNSDNACMQTDPELPWSSQALIWPDDIDGVLKSIACTKGQTCGYWQQGLFVFRNWAKRRSQFYKKGGKDCVILHELWYCSYFFLKVYDSIIQIRQKSKHNLVELLQYINFELNQNLRKIASSRLMI